MKRIIGNSGSSSGGNNNKSKKKKPPKRVSDKVHAEYEYAINEYYQTVSPHQANDDGTGNYFDFAYYDELPPRISPGESSQRRKTSTATTTTPNKKKAMGTFPLTRGIMSPIQEQRSNLSSSGDTNNTYSYQTPTSSKVGASSSSFSTNKKRSDSNSPATVKSSDPNTAISPTLEYVSMASPTDSINGIDDEEKNKYNNNNTAAASLQQQQQQQEATMPDATYEEFYGDAYVGAPIKYIYPAGYQSMRPRGGPWKLSIAICILFTWLSVFIVGHCSDRAAAAENTNNDDGNGNASDDDKYVIEQRWCGSKLLYFLWVMSMLITGLAAAYCSVIGYIKVRDFAVANLRSQPPGMVGKSDYYVTIEDNAKSNVDYYKKTIYQADGTPQFWGGHIYRPTQAAVAVTSR